MSGGIAIPAPKQKKEKQQQPPPGAPVGSGAPKPPAGPVGAGGSDWAAVGKVDELFTLERPAKAVILPSGIKLCVYKYGNKVIRTDAAMWRKDIGRAAGAGPHGRAARPRHSQRRRAAPARAPAVQHARPGARPAPAPPRCLRRSWSRPPTSSRFSTASCLRRRGA